EFGEIDAAGGPIYHDAHRSLGGMGTKIDHRTFEAGIAHHGHGDQELAIEIAGTRRIVANADLGANVGRVFSFRVHPQSTLFRSHILILGGPSVNQAPRTAKGSITSNSMVSFNGCL